MRDLTRWRTTADHRVRWRLEFKLEDFWIGAFWRFGSEAAGTYKYVELWICLVPCLPLHLVVELLAAKEGV